MRELLFRGKRLDNGEWVEGGIIFWQNGGASIVEITGHIREDGIEDAISHPVDINTVGQYTGLNDKDGKKVFEGDILFYHGDNADSFNGVMRYGKFDYDGYDGAYGWYLNGGDIGDFNTDDKRVYVAGNIYDNHELLEEER